MRTRPSLYPLQITWFDACDSTNRLLLQAAEGGAPAGTVFVAREQTSGRGRRGRSWVMASGDSLAFSLLWVFPANPAKLSGLPLAVGLAVVLALESAALGERRSEARCGLKWPNDLLVHRADDSYAKAGGVLVESVLRHAATGGKELAVVIGVGLNCKQSNRLSHAVTDQLVGSLAELFVDDIEPEALLPEVLASLCATLDGFLAQGFAPYSHPWNTRNLWQNQTVCIREGQDVLLSGICRGVDKEGALCLETSGGLQRVFSGDVSLRRV